MVYGIVKQSGGYIWAYSEPGLGTTMKLYFRSVTDSLSAEGSPTPEHPAQMTGGTVLVVEDDPLVRGMARRSLVAAGFEVLEAANGREALALVDAESKLAAVLTDLAMPEISGRELARRLRKTHPNLPVVFMSGYTGDDVIRRGLLERGVPFLEKPLSPEALATKIRQIVNQDVPTIGSQRM
jgi:two-component system cell cycle sensor histidine kinase/response regulator CckA